MFGLVHYHCSGYYSCIKITLKLSDLKKIFLCIRLTIWAGLDTCSSSLLYMVSPGLLEGWGPESSEGSLSHIAIDASCKAEPFGLLAAKPTNGCISHAFYLLYSDVLTS